MSLSKFDMLVKQNEQVKDDELTRFLDYCNGITAEGREFEINITLHLDVHAENVLIEPLRKLDIDVVPLSPLDESWNLWLDASKFPLLAEWAEKQPSFQLQIEATVNQLRREIGERELMVTRVIDHWLKPLIKEQGNRTKLEIDLKSHGNRPTARKS